MLLGGADDMPTPRRAAARPTGIRFDAKMIGVRTREAYYDVDTLAVHYWREGMALGAADWLSQCRYHGAMSAAIQLRWADRSRRSAGSSIGCFADLPTLTHVPARRGHFGQRGGWRDPVPAIYDAQTVRALCVP